MIEESVQLVLPIIFRNVGPLLLRGGLGGLSGGGGAMTNNSDDDDIDDDESDTMTDNSGTSTREGAGGRKVSISLPTFPPDTEDDEDSNNDENKDEINTIKSTDQTQVSSQNTKETTNPIQTSTKPTVTTTEIEQQTTHPPPSSTSTAPSLIRTTEETITQLNSIQTTNPSSSIQPSQSDESNALGTSDGTPTTAISPDVDGILSFTESTESSVDTTTDSGFDFNGRIDIRSNIEDENTTTDDATNVDNTTIPLFANNADIPAESSNSKHNIVANDKQFLNNQYLPALTNLVRRRKSVVVKRRHF